MLTDPRGIAITASNAASVASLEMTVMGYAGFKADTGDRLKAALNADSGMPMAHLLRGYFMMLLMKRELVARAEDSATAAEKAMDGAGATHRERNHLDALRAWISGDRPGTIARLKAILAEHPRDLVALKIVQYLLFYAGDWRDMHMTVDGAVGQWDASLPGYGYMLGCHAFGLEECGDYRAAEAVGRRGLALTPDDIWGTHAVAHVFEMEDRAEEGVAWIDATAPHWAAANNFTFHLWWHRCLFLLEQGRLDEALDAYDRQVRPESNDEYLDITNAVALLWRFEQLGMNVGLRWEELALRCTARCDDHLVVFGDAHLAVAIAAGGNADDIAQFAASCRRFAAESSESQASLMGEVGIALSTAVLAHRREDYGYAVDLLLPIRQAVRQIGGSHAQRDLFAKLLIDSAVKAGRLDTAETLLRERLTARPKNAWGLAQRNLAAHRR